MYADEKDVIYYLMAMNEKYTQPAMPKGVEAGIIKGMYLFKAGAKAENNVQLLGSGAILNEVVAAAELLKNDFAVTADVWSVTSFSELYRDGVQVSRHNMLNPEAETKQPYVAQCLKDHQGPVIAATDYVRAYSELIRPYLKQAYTTLGTDGFGRSDTRERLRHFFEVDRYHIVIAALKALADEGKIKLQTVTAAIKKYGIDPNKPHPITV